MQPTSISGPPYESWGPSSEPNCSNDMGVRQFKQVDFVGQNHRFPNNPYNNTYNLWWRNHPNFSWR